MNENEIQNRIRIALGRVSDLRLFRNNVGTAKLNGRFVRYGLSVGSSDLIGFLRLEPPIVPYRIARFISLEVKAESGKTTEEQRMWLECVRDFGGFACVVRSVDEALAAIERARNGESQ